VLKRFLIHLFAIALGVAFALAVFYVLKAKFQYYMFVKVVLVTFYIMPIVLFFIISQLKIEDVILFYISNFLTFFLVYSNYMNVLWSE